MVDGHVGHRPAILAAILGTAALALSFTTLAAQLPGELWISAVFQPPADDVRQMVVHYSWLPRLVTSLLAGAALALIGTAFQQLLRNPLASPTTLGVESGASAALALATLFAPELLNDGREAIAFAGGLAAAGLVFALSWRRGSAPLSLILAGLLVSLFFGAIAAALMLLKERALAGLFIWGKGSLNQQDWSAVTYIAPRFIVVMAILIAMTRPLTLLGLDSASAEQLGLRLAIVRFVGLMAVVALTASVVSAVGVIAFVGLAAPAIVQSAGARRFRERLIWSPVIGAALLWFADQAVLVLNRMFDTELPTGTVTALAGAPVLLWVINRSHLTPAPVHEDRHSQYRRATGGTLLTIALLLVLGAALSLTIGRGTAGWRWSAGAELDMLLTWRAPRVTAAAAAGAMLATAGVLLQRLTGNPMASPEVLGVTAGAALGLLLALLGLGGLGQETALLAGFAGAGLALAALLAFGHRSGLAPNRIVLAGIAFGAIVDALIGVLQAGGDPRAMLLLTWLSGSTYGIDGSIAAVTAIAACALLSTAILLVRWLDLLPLGPVTSQALGIDLGCSRLAIIVLTALLTAAGCLVAGTLSFVGLMAPHFALKLGLQRALPHLLGSALFGSLIMIVADWLGRVALFPRQMPAGLVAMLVGVPVMMWLAARRD
ncbi:Fe(3+)-hydroxamate ABC transporter permease FhuB [Bradyrhizobium sp. CCGUVB1N3]|uniref:Fe(3+)-hydroxamate ABC transporter permease FhuB n=1 Tax=Bradyrhizobium sp. CCGUVB1N3 TaxID=2949629 RepID=UPI0020B4106A|nr:Fe(3+)-hydroxamate ABC transporter permease FhuB [Bradyrhizobium sp. CCGUVB1N3]MCP3469088.1 Fe(3+)-hydroxamate ABC transporter permease FhuB [Bradyrhizobium sp. CCGUVB1N3]